MSGNPDPRFPCTLLIEIPFPTARLASIAYNVLRVDNEISPLVQRSFAVVAQSLPTSNRENSLPKETMLKVEYKATTNRMLRVATNGFLERLGVIIGVMEGLDGETSGGSLKVS